MEEERVEDDRKESSWRREERRKEGREDMHAHPSPDAVAM